jgi:hypothetical protein
MLTESSPHRGNSGNSQPEKYSINNHCDEFESKLHLCVLPVLRCSCRRQQHPRSAGSCHLILRRFWSHRANRHSKTPDCLRELGVSDFSLKKY